MSAETVAVVLMVTAVVGLFLGALGGDFLRWWER